MTEEIVRDLFLICWTQAPVDEVLVTAQQVICREVFLEIAAQNKIELDEARHEMLFKMTGAMARLSHFHGLQGGAPINIPPYYQEHLGFISAAYKDAIRYCYENYDQINHFIFIRGLSKAEVKQLLDRSHTRDRELDLELKKTNKVTFAKGEFLALHELFCFILQAMLGQEAFSRFMEEMNKALVFLRKQQAHFSARESGDQKPS